MVDFITEKQKEQVERLIQLNNQNKISVGLHVVFDLDKLFSLQVKEQFEKFKKILGFTPSHIDYHKYIDNIKCMNAVINFGDEHNLPVRYMKVKPKTKHTTHPVIETMSLDIFEIKKRLNQMNDGESCEVLCHPGEYDSDSKTSFNEERTRDCEGIIKLQNYFETYNNYINISYNEL